MSRLIRKSTNSGIGLYRSDNELVGVRAVSKLKTNDDFNNDGTKITTQTFCGSISQSSVSAIQDSSKNTGVNIQGGSGSSVQSKIEEIEENCDYIELIIVINGIFYGFIINPPDTTNGLPYYLELSNSGKCVNQIIGQVRVITSTIDNSINGRMSRWAFEDGKRVILNRKSGNPQLVKPYISGYISDNSDRNDYSLVNKHVLIPHYGWFGQTYNKFVGMEGSGANIAGCGEQFDFIQFSMDWFLMSERQIDYNMIDTQGNDIPSYTGNFIRIGSIDEFIDCNGEKPFDTNDRFRFLINQVRVCTTSAPINPVKDDNSTNLVIEGHLTSMTNNLYLDDIDPNTGLDTKGRLLNGGVPFKYAEGLVGSCGNNVGMTEQEATDLLFESIFSNEEYKLIIYDNNMYRLRFDLKLGSNNNWYGYCIFKTTEIESESLLNFKVILPRPPQIDYSTFDIFIDWDSYRAFPTKPANIIYPSCLTFWSHNAYTTVGKLCSREMNSYAIHETSGLFGPYTIPDGSMSANGIRSNNGWTYGNSIVRNASSVINEYFTYYYIEYNPSSKSIFLKIHDLEFESCPGYLSPCNDDFYEIPSYLSDSYVRNNIQFMRNKNNLYVSGDIRYDGNEQVYDEIEPVEPSSLFGGDTELFFGTTLIDSISPTGSGSHLNPFQTITVASTFHSNSGYTCILYTKTNTLKNIAIRWSIEEFSGNNQIYEKYFWLRQSLWCAVIDNSGYIVAKFEVKATLPQKNDDYYEYWSDDIPQNDPPNERVNFLIQTDGVIKKDSVEIYCKINGNSVLVYTDDDGNVVESKGQVPGYDSVVSNCVIDFNAGVIEIEYNIPPDINSNVVFYAYVSSFDIILGDIHFFTEHSHYCLDRYDGGGAYSFTTKFIGGAGYQPISPTVSISEDGHYLVVGTRIAEVFCKGEDRVAYSKTAKPYFSENNAIPIESNNYYDTPQQVMIYDMFAIELGRPKIVGKPFFMNKHKEVCETLILN